ncbi:hypothetical protein [Bacillus sp. UNCCL81]|uniref:hypothetical protein n=1 Tax=Bacillus sp. UNCCL81 TaxID=1502755 RepID=UPI00158791AF|nr:hypothetical protein [Bacillus sp. UNCCL81]
MKWNNENVTFETLREAEVWAESLANEIHGRIYNGYITPDCKIAYVLAFKLALNNFEVHTEEDFINESPIYKVWVNFTD